MIDATRDHIEARLAAHRYCLVTAGSIEGFASLPARYRAVGLEVDCLLPLWSEASYYVEDDPRVELVIGCVFEDIGSWLQLRGTAQILDLPDWPALLSQRPGMVAPADLYRVIRVRPTRIDLFDERRGWGARETLDLE
jgi:hypothetical protein